MVREKGTILDTAIERTGCQDEPAEGRPKVVAGHSRHESEGLREEFEPERYPTETRKQREPAMRGPGKSPVRNVWQSPSS
jgi:hypothetical protein